jgi:hypothetical protein
MNSNPHDRPQNLMASETTSDSVSASAFTPAEETLRLIAKLPAPDGLEDRVHAALNAMPRGSRVLSWPKTFHPMNGWMRGAAAAAIVFVVAGGGWGVYTRVQSTQIELNQPAKAIVMPARTPVAGGFSGAGAMRTPLTLPRPTAPETAKTSPAKTKEAKKPVANGKTSGDKSIGPAASSEPAESAPAGSEPAAQPGAPR